MKSITAKIIVILLGVAFISACVADITPTPDITTTPFVPTPVSCVAGDQIPYVYHPDRLIVITDCIRVLGKIEAIRDEADGDLHVIVRLSPEDSAKYLNAGNSHQNGDLVVEPICFSVPTQSDAIEPCYKDPNPLKVVPKVGDCVLLEGRLVEDTSHYNWREIHPLGQWTLSASCP